MIRRKAVIKGYKYLKIIIELHFKGVAGYSRY